MKFQTLMIAAMILSSASCCAMRKLDASTPDFFFTTCQMPNQHVIIDRLKKNTFIFDENEQETYNLSYFLANKEKSVVDIESTAHTILRRYYTNLALQDVGSLGEVPKRVADNKQDVLTALLQDYPEIVKEFKKQWNEESAKK